MASTAINPTAINDAIPASLRAITIVIVLLMLALMTAELVVWVHGQMPWSYLLIVLGSEMLVVAVWLTLEMRSRRYATPSVERPSRWFLHHLRRLPLLMLGFYVFTHGMRYLAFAAIGERYGTAWQFGILIEGIKVALLYPCWLGVVFGFRSFHEMRERNERLLHAQRSLAEAQLTQLRAQLRPHFLFNALNTVSATMQADVSRADRLLTLLGDLLRANLESSDRNLVTLAEEIDLLRRYADIMLARFGDRVALEWHLEPDAMPVTIPSMLLQPLLENAFKHGVERNAEPQTIRIAACRTTHGATLTIHNTVSQLAQPYREGFGTRSCRERLALIYAGGASFTLREHPAGGVEAKIDMPVQNRTA